MTLLELRTKFVEESGYYQLVTDAAGGDYSNNGADYYIQAGSRLLDGAQEIPQHHATYPKDIVAGDHKVVFSDNRSMESVWVVGEGVDNDKRAPLSKRSWEWFKREYNKPVEDWDTGTPLVYSRALINLSPGQQSLTAAGGASPYTAQFTYDWEDLTFGTDAIKKTGIIFAPAADQAYTIIVKGRWWSWTLSADTDENYWSATHPEVLIFAARWVYEAGRRNTAGMNDFLGAIAPYLKNINNDMVQEEIAEINELEDPESYDNYNDPLLYGVRGDI